MVRRLAVRDLDARGDAAAIEALWAAARTEPEGSVLALIASALVRHGCVEAGGVLRERVDARANGPNSGSLDAPRGVWSASEAWMIRDAADRLGAAAAVGGMGGEIGRARTGRVRSRTMDTNRWSRGGWSQQPDGRHVLEIAPMRAGEVRELLSRTHRWVVAGGPAQAPRAGVTVALLFFEDSTRTRLSFAAAGQRLGAGVIDLGVGASSVNKGESLVDTAYTIDAMGVSAMVVRTREGGGAHLVARALERVGSSCAVVNAGDGRHEHPTQALLDAYALCEAMGRVGTGDPGSFDLSGVRVAIVGDVLNSRVARSGTACLTKLGASVTLCGPRSLAPPELAEALRGDDAAGPVSVSHDFDALAGAVDAVIMLRVQFERHEGRSAVFGSRQTYRDAFGLDADRLARFERALGTRLVVMHPGPMNRGLEITGDAADGPGSIVRRQVTLGVAVRTAVLSAVLDGRPG